MWKGRSAQLIYIKRAFRFKWRTFRCVNRGIKINTADSERPVALHVGVHSVFQVSWVTGHSWDLCFFHSSVYLWCLASVLCLHAILGKMQTSSLGLIKNRTCPPIHLCQTSRSSQAGSSGATVSLPVESPKISSFILLIRHGHNVTLLAGIIHLNPSVFLCTIFPRIRESYEPLGKSGVGSGRSYGGRGLKGYSHGILYDSPLLFEDPSSVLRSEAPARDSGLQISWSHTVTLPFSTSPIRWVYKGIEMSRKVQWGCFQSASQRRTVYPIRKTNRALLGPPLKMEALISTPAPEHWAGYDRTLLETALEEDPFNIIYNSVNHSISLI